MSVMVEFSTHFLDMDTFLFTSKEQFEFPNLLTATTCVSTTAGSFKDIAASNRACL